MSQILSLALVELVKQGIPLAIDLFQVLSKADATDADWDALRLKWTKSYDQRISEAEARLRPGPV